MANKTAQDARAMLLLARAGWRIDVTPEYLNRLSEELRDWLEDIHVEIVRMEAIRYKEEAIRRQSRS